MLARPMVHDQDPKEKLLKAVGDLSKFTIFGSFVLLAVYERPEKTKSGIILTDTTRGEDAHQGKSALIVAKGPAAFVNGPDADFYGLTADVGDWVSIFVTDGRRIVVNKTLCRIVEDIHIRMKIPGPDVVY